MAEDDSILASLGLNPDDELLDAPDTVWAAAITAALDPATQSSGADTVPIMDDQPVVPDDDDALAAAVVVTEDQPVGSDPGTHHPDSDDPDLNDAVESDDVELPVLDHDSLDTGGPQLHTVEDTGSSDL
jgi:hypothetical protein